MFEFESKPVQGWLRRAAAVAPPPAAFGPIYKDRELVFICMTPRSGSTYLGSLMRDNGLGNGQEHFRVSGGTMKNYVENLSLENYDQYFRALVNSRTRDGFFTAKVDWLQFIPIYYFGVYAHYLRKAHFIYLTRGDLLMQAISRYIGTETGYFHSVNTDKEHTKDVEVPFNFDKIRSHLTHLIDMQNAWEWFFGSEGVSPLRVRYEELESDPRAVLEQVAAHVGRSVAPDAKIDTEYKKVRNERNERLRDAFIAEVRARNETFIAKYVVAAGAA